jgi:hypothetical protein
LACSAIPDLTLSGANRLDSQDRAARRYLNGGNASAIEHQEPVTMAGAKHARVFCKCFDDSLDGFVLVAGIVLILDVELVTAHESDSQHYRFHAHAPSIPAPRRWPVEANCHPRPE